ncbi:MAG: hypothetical protein RL143_923 [Pseudomonadota bacterium]
MSEPPPVLEQCPQLSDEMYCANTTCPGLVAEDACSTLFCSVSSSTCVPDGILANKLAKNRLTRRTEI